MSKHITHSYMIRLGMARRILLFAALLFAMGAVAQNMSVKSFELLEKDLTANIAGTSRISKQDGKPAALIKVITMERGYNFDGGTYSIVDVVEQPGEYWVYMPARAQKLTVTHPKFGRLDNYFFPMPIESGKTYSMVLDPGVGRYVTIQTEKPRSAVFVDGDSIGISPIYNYYMLYGDHKLSAQNDRWQGQTTLSVQRDGTDDVLNVTVPMEDQSVHFGQVYITTDPDATIIFNGTPRATGSWVTELREGDYTVETQKLNADNSVTRFTVKAQSPNMVQATAPVPHTGQLSLYTRPRDAELFIDGKRTERADIYELPVGSHTIELTRKDYYNKSQEITLRNRQLLLDTLNMERVQYLKPNSFYLGAAYTVGTFSGATFIVGGTMKHIDLQLSYMLGLSKSSPVNYYNTADKSFLCRGEYKLSAFSAKLGYQIPLVTRFGITPQVGYAAHMLSGTKLSGEQALPKEDLSAACATVGVKLIYSPMQHFCLFAAPEYDIAVSKGKQFAEIADAAGFSVGGFFCHLGIIVNF